MNMNIGKFFLIALTFFMSCRCATMTNIRDTQKIISSSVQLEVFENELLNKIKKYDDSISALLVWLTTISALTIVSAAPCYFVLNTKVVDNAISQMMYNPSYNTPFFTLLGVIVAGFGIIGGTAWLLAMLYLSIKIVKIYVNKMNILSEISAVREFFENGSYEKVKDIIPELDLMYSKYVASDDEFIRQHAADLIQTIRSIKQYNIVRIND